MSSIESEGATIDEAIARALGELGVPRDRAEIEILTNSTKGLFGMGGRKARVRATVRATLDLTAEPVVDVPAEVPVASATKVPRVQESKESSLDEDGPDPATVERARPLLQEIVQRMGISAEIRTEDGPEGTFLSIHGDGSGILIGRQGQTLDALEYIINRIVARDEEHPRRITLDSEGYRTRRRQTLEQLAQRTAAKVRTSGRPLTLDPMSPRDRRVIHLTLQNDLALATRSTGDGYYRQVMITPKRGRGGSRPDSRGSQQ